MPLIDRLVRTLRPYRFPGKTRLFNRLVHHSGVRRASVYGVTMDLDLADYIQRNIYLGCYEMWEATAVRRWLPRGGTMIDVGANVGFFTAVAASCVGPAGRVLAVEPDPASFRKLSAMVAENGLGGVVTPLHCGAADSRGEQSLYVVPDEHYPNHSPSMLPDPNVRPILVPVRTLDDILDEHGVGRVDLLKIDVEGFELKVLAGTERALAQRRVRAVLCEFSDQCLRLGGNSPEALWRKLADAGFVDVRQQSGVPPFPPGCHEDRFFVLGPGA